ncbi:MAG TPA: MFS transporter [Terriglobales bacterium]|nr:MFS transporter [Terriglobales bacterium]
MAHTPSEKISSGNWHAVTAGFLGWTLDAFDFFVVIFLYDILAAHFQVPKSQILWAVSATLFFRPVGAVIFGLLADRYGRRVPLMANVIFFSVVGFATGFTDAYWVFFVLRCLYGIGMGGEWGVGASLAMENAPPRWRGLLSGILQSGYSIGYLLAAVAARVILPNPDLSWRWMFWIGGVPALLALYIRSSVPESEAWKQHRLPDFTSIARMVAGQWKRFLYLVLLMTLFMFLSHGTQDLYPDFLKTEFKVPQRTVADLAILYNIGAVLGAVIFGHLSERIGRRRSIIAALALSFSVLPFWAFGGNVLILACGAFIIQMGVQGAWGIVPAHLNEMAPDSVRGLMPGLAYQMGILFASPTNNIQHALQQTYGYSWAIFGFEFVVILALGLVTWLGTENKGKSLTRPAVAAVDA